MNKYNATEKQDDKGRTIYHLVTGHRGRPPQFVKVGGKYIALKGMKKS